MLDVRVARFAGWRHHVFRQEYRGQPPLEVSADSFDRVAPLVVGSEVQVADHHAGRAVEGIEHLIELGQRAGGVDLVLLQLQVQRERMPQAAIGLDQQDRLASVVHVAVPRCIAAHTDQGLSTVQSAKA
jgi:hypothetical protein